MPLPFGDPPTDMNHRFGPVVNQIMPMPLRCPSERPSGPAVDLVARLVVTDVVGNPLADLISQPGQPLVLELVQDRPAGPVAEVGAKLLQIRVGPALLACMERHDESGALSKVHSVRVEYVDVPLECFVDLALDLDERAFFHPVGPVRISPEREPVEARSDP